MAPFTAIAKLLAASAQLHPIAFSGPGPYEKGHEYLEDASAIAEKQMGFDLWHENGKAEINAPHWKFSTRLHVAPITDSPVANAQRLNTVYDFIIPGGQNLTDAVATNPAHLDSANFCVSILETALPPAETKLYDEKSERDAGCSNVFTQHCERILKQLHKETAPGPDGCRFSQIDFNNIVQCEWVFADSHSHFSTFNLLKPGLNITGGFAHITSNVYDGGDSTIVDIAENRIHSVLIDSGDTFTPVCARIADKKKKGDKRRV